MTVVGDLIQLELANKTATIGLRTLTPKNDSLRIIAKAHAKKVPLASQATMFRRELNPFLKQWNQLYMPETLFEKHQRIAQDQLKQK